MKLIIAEKPSVAKSIALALGASSRADSFYEGSGLLVSWCVGHLVSPMDAGGYDERFKKWRYDDLPILPEPFRYVLAPGKEDTFENLRALMDRPAVDTIVNACDAGREGELIFRLVYEMAGCASRSFVSGFPRWRTALSGRVFLICTPAPIMKPCINLPSAARKRIGWWGSMPLAFSLSSITVP